MKMDWENEKYSPLVASISFHKVLETLEKIADSDVDYRSEYAKALLKHTEPFPELRDGITDLRELDKHQNLIKNLMADLFPTALQKNEIKAATIPFFNFTFNRTERFEKILKNAGSEFGMSIRNFEEHEFYIFSCCLILNSYYGQKFDFSRPLFYDIPDEDGVMKHYRILYNADFLEIIPTEKAKTITPEDITLLMNNFDDLSLWKDKFPPGSWIVKGFGIVSLFDATSEIAISNLKSNLLLINNSDTKKEVIKEQLEDIFRSIFNIPDIHIGFTEVNNEDNSFKAPPFKGIRSHVLFDCDEMECSEVFCNQTLDTMFGGKKNFIISDVEEFLANKELDARFAEHLLSQDIRSIILAPIVKNDRLLGFFEVVSSKARELNSINAVKLDYILPYLTDTIDRNYSELQNEIDAIIQNEYTAIHNSVYWKFRDEALKHIADPDKELSYKEIVFKEVYPLYGQIDIKGSSTARNDSIEKDLIRQIEKLLSVFRFIHKQEKLPLIQQHVYELENMENELKNSLKADTESIVQSYIATEIHPILEHFDTANTEVHDKIEDYFKTLDSKVKMVYDCRKDFDETLSLINKQMAAILDQKQVEAQAFFPHYYERFKTDGVEHNLYIGASISPKSNYSPLYLSNLRLWQMQAMCEMESEYYRIRPTLPYDLDVTSLILVFSSPISIRFRMDEKRFDVDGTYNARYEVVKKRIDKAYIKGTTKRITEKGKLTIVYSQKQEEMEYRRYIQYLQHNNMLDGVVENFEVEDLQGVTGLKALRVDILYNNSQRPNEALSYDDLIKEFSEKK
ncbi:GAF domain-containing protein [Flavobacterium sp. DG1-102-2]|uniref:GAF domain-containing protein n=1 Tax=Flavobacterium sp. DG1-102-2 TaxID=3081663 RepID=UPI0029492DCD|nr:GAF domain-containing protein [Flavobacterium sp. DG1-102-2]MDV6168761.1 GAF domain-containing protein [Flavobacterium sp. DG1-102-2]